MGAAGLLRARARGTVACGDDVWLDTARGIDVDTGAPRDSGYVLPEYALFGHLRAWQNVAYRLTRALPRGSRRRRAHELLERFGIGALADARTAHALGRGAPAGRAGSGACTRPAGRCCSTSRCPRSTRAPGRPRGASWAAVLARGRRPRAAGHPRLRGGGAVPATRSAVVDGGRGACTGGAARLAAEPASAFVADFTGAVVLDRDRAARAAGAPTEVALDGGGAVIRARPRPRARWP